MTAALVAICATHSSAQDPVSFRSLALGGVIDDDLDLIYDPVELGFVDGTRLYTNLSNLTSNGERLFDNASDDELLLGIGGENPWLDGLFSSALVRMSDTDTPLSLELDSDLDGYPDLFGQGELGDEFRAVRDTDFDGIFDFEQTISQSLRAANGFGNLSLVVNNTKRHGEMIYGLQLGWMRSSSDRSTASSVLGSGHSSLSPVWFGAPSRERSLANVDLIDDFETDRWSESGDFSTESEYSTTAIQLAAMKPWSEDLELRGDLRLDLLTNSTLRVRDRYQGMIEVFDAELGDFQDTYDESDRYDRLLEESGQTMTLALSLRQTFEQGTRRVDDGYWFLGASLGRGSFDYDDSWSGSFVSSERYFDGSDTLATDFNDDFSSDIADTERGTRTVWSYGLRGRWSKPLGSKALLAIGGRWSRSESTLETDLVGLFASEAVFEVVDGDSTAADYTETETEGLSFDRTLGTLTTMWAVPVGLEYLFTDNGQWALRLGALFSHSRSTTDDARQVRSSEPFTVRHLDGEGELWVDVDDNVYDSVHERYESASSSTVFSYGLGYKPTANLQFDLLGFLGTSEYSVLDTPFYRDLRLSVSLLFD